VVTFFSIIAIILLLSLLFLVLKPRKKTKTKAQKQELKTGLANIQNTETRQKRKLVLLKAYAKELEFNLFFDKDEVKVLIEELASY